MKRSKRQNGSLVVMDMTAEVSKSIMLSAASLMIFGVRMS